MRRTEILQEIRKMRFEEAYDVWTEGRLTQEAGTGLFFCVVRAVPSGYRGNPWMNLSVIPVFLSMTCRPCQNDMGMS